ncbi:unnamed protein product, partial [Iphiclides podalirius]
MFKLYILLAAFATVNCEFRCALTHKAAPCRNRYRQHRHNIRYYNTVFLELSSSVISADQDYQTACDPNYVSEYYGLDFYTLRYLLPDYIDENIVVKTRHRVLYVSARNSTRVFNDIKILPRVVDARSGQWFKDNAELNILFNYRTPPKTETVLTCDVFVDDQVRQVANFIIGND